MRTLPKISPHFNSKINRTMSEKIIIEYDIQEDDIKRMWRYTSWDAPYLQLMRQKNVASILSVVAFILTFIIYIDVNSFNKEFLLKFSILFLLFTIPLIGCINNRVGVTMEKKAVKSLLLPENRNVLGDIYLAFDKEKIYAKTDIAETSYTWNAITKITISDDDYYLNLLLGLFVLIPKRVFKTNEERNIFENLLRSKMPITDYRTKNPNE
jgi:hypothetical protein